MPDTSMAVVGFGDVPDGDGWLGPNERTAARRFTFPPRRAAWRAGRWAARLALAGLRRTDGGGIEILAAPDGAPEAIGSDGTVAAAVSISHRGQVAAALAAPTGVAVGCDVELVEPRPDGFGGDWFTPAELAAVGAAPADDRVVLTTVIWSAKETALKVLRRGLRMDPRQAGVEVDGDRFRVTVDGLQIDGWWRRDGPYVITAAALEKKR